MIGEVKKEYFIQVVFTFMALIDHTEINKAVP